MSPTPAGEGKTTTSIGLSEGLNKIGKKSIVVLREPSLGPVFGIKGGAAGGGYAQVIPMEDINLHFTGDFSAVEKANNLLAALIDNNIQSKTRSLNIDPRTVIWKRVMDMNDRSLRDIVIGLGGTANGIPRQDGFNAVNHSPSRAARISILGWRIRQHLPGEERQIGPDTRISAEFKRFPANWPRLAQELFYYRVTLSGTDWSSPLWR